MTQRNLKSVLALASLLALGACGTMNDPGYTSSTGTSGSGAGYPQSGPSVGSYARTGTVQNIELVSQESSGVGVGTIAGAVVGGILGNQVGKGSGKTAATVLGAAGGAYAGNQIEKRNQQQSDAYKITVRMRDGSYQTVMQTASNDIRVGDRVQIDNGVAMRY